MKIPAEPSVLPTRVPMGFFSALDEHPVAGEAVHAVAGLTLRKDAHDRWVNPAGETLSTEWTVRTFRIFFTP